MVISWREAYKELTDFISAHPEIELKPDSVSIPGGVRPEFYRLFNNARGTFIQDKHPEALADSQALSREYQQVEAEVIKQLGLIEIIPSAPLGWYLHDPVDGLYRSLFDPLFYLLKGHVDISGQLKADVDIEGFEQGASASVETNYREFYYAGYEKWVVLNLVRMLEADNIFDMPQRPIGHSERALLVADSEEVPLPVETKAMSFDHAADQRLLTSDFIIHSANMNNFVAVRTEVFKWGTGNALTSARNASEKREWLGLNFMEGLGSGLTFVFMADNPEDISLTGDLKRICRPDMLLAYRCKGRRNWLEKQRLEWIQHYHQWLQPRMGTVMVCLETTPEPAGTPEPVLPGIDILKVGYEPEKLMPILIKLKADSSLASGCSSL
jgi:hypothetical protein